MDLYWQTADQQNLKVNGVEDVINEVQQWSRIAVADIPAKSIIEFVD